MTPEDELQLQELVASRPSFKGWEVVRAQSMTLPIGWVDTTVSLIPPTVPKVIWHKGIRTVIKDSKHGLRYILQKMKSGEWRMGGRYKAKLVLPHTFPSALSRIAARVIFNSPNPLIFNIKEIESLSQILTLIQKNYFGIEAIEAELANLQTEALIDEEVA